MFQVYLCVISDNIRVNDNIFQPGFQNMLSLTLLLSEHKHHNPETCLVDDLCVCVCVGVCLFVTSLPYRSVCRGPSIYDVHKEGRGGQAKVDACGRGEGSSPVWTSTQRIKIKVHCLLLMQRSWRLFFTRISSLDRKKWQYFCDIN